MTRKHLAEVQAKTELKSRAKDQLLQHQSKCDQTASILLETEEKLKVTQKSESTHILLLKEAQSELQLLLNTRTQLENEMVLLQSKLHSHRVKFEK